MIPHIPQKSCSLLITIIFLMSRMEKINTFAPSYRLLPLPSSSPSYTFRTTTTDGSSIITQRMNTVDDNVNDNNENITPEQKSELESESESIRLTRDKEAMDAMKTESESAFAKLRTPWKWTIRQRVWDNLEAKNIARPPRPVHHRIPNFEGAELAAQRLALLPEYINAKIIKVNPDTPQKPVRRMILENGKTLLTPQPRLRTGFFTMVSEEIIPSDVPIAKCAATKGVAQYGTPVGLNETYKVDMVVVGSTAVCPKTGARVGKGEGFAELEWGILTLQGNINASWTPVVTTVHEEQIVDDIPVGQLTKHDVPVDIIVTPSRIIRVPNRAPKPSGVFWDLLSPQKLAQIKVLRQLKQEIEEERGTLPEGPEEVLPPTAKRDKKNFVGGNRKSNSNSKPDRRNHSSRVGNRSNRRKGGNDKGEARLGDKSGQKPQAKKQSSE